MCVYCNGRYGDEEMIDHIRCDAVPEGVFLCDAGWAEASRIWGKYGWAKKLITPSEWRAVCRSRGETLFG